MLKSIPFFSELLNKQITETVKSVNSHVLVYGAIEIHSNGKKGCIASNETIAKECGLSAGTVANCLSQMNLGRWIFVEMKGRRRVSIKPLLTIGYPPPKKDDSLHLGVKSTSSGSEVPLHLEMNIDNSEITVENTVSDKSEEVIFSLEEFYSSYLATDSRMNKLIVYYMKLKVMTFTSRKEAERMFGRYRKVAKELTDSYSNDQIKVACAWCIEQYIDKWTLETVQRKLPELISKM